MKEASHGYGEVVVGSKGEVLEGLLSGVCEAVFSS